MSDAANPRRGLLVSAATLACWAVSVLSLVFYVFAVGVSSEQRRAAEALFRNPWEASADPLVVLLLSTLGLGLLTLFSLLYYGYVQWKDARRRRLALERDLEADRT